MNTLYNANSIGIFGILFLSFLIHEIGHVVAALRYKISVGNMGVGLYLFRPVLYTDLSDAWRLDKKKRVVTDLGGVYFQGIFLLLLSICLLFYHTDTLKISILSILAAIITNLNPVLRFDGYWIATDLLGIVNIDKRTFEYFKSWIRNLVKYRTIKTTININFKKGLKRVFYIYIVLYIIFTIAAIIVGIFLVMLADTQNRPGRDT
jgi:putative peptide zinc metalloprotease protein